MTARELADRLQVSPAAVSGAVRYLEQARLVRRVREPGERTDRFVLGDDAWYEAIADRSEIFDGLLSALAEGLVAVGDGSVAGQRIAETSEFFAYLKDEMPLLIERWRSSRAVPTPRSSPRR